MNKQVVPVVTLDGLGGAGKGTIGLRLAQALSWNYLDSGVFYRLLALEANRQNIALRDEITLAKLAAFILPQFEIQNKINGYARLVVIWEGKAIEGILRTEEYGLKAAQVAVYPAVRTALVAAQRKFRKVPGLIADGRDMGQVIFPDALFKFLLTASVDERTRRRGMQLKQPGNYASLTEIKNAIIQRDKIDQVRLAPMLHPNQKVSILDTTYLSITEVMAAIEQKLSTVGLYFH